MGAGLSAQAKVKELRALPEKEAIGFLQQAGVSKAEAKIVIQRVREMKTVDAVGVAMLVDGLSAATQDALAALTQAKGSSLAGSIASKTSLEDEMDMLLSQGWSEPPASLDDGRALVGFNVWVAGYGKGRVTEFVRARVGTSSHVVDFQNPVEGAARISRTVKLRRKGNSESRWLVKLPTTVVVGEDDAERAGAARDARLSLLGGRSARGTGPAEPEPEPEQMQPARPVTPPWVQRWKANAPHDGNPTQQQRLHQRRHHGVERGAPQLPTAARCSNGLTAGGKQPSTPRRHPIPTSSSSSSNIPLWDLEPVSTSTVSISTTTAAAFVEALAARGDSWAALSTAEEICESLDGDASNSNRTPQAQESSFSASLEQFLEEEAGGISSLPTVSSASSVGDAVEFGTFGSTTSEGPVQNTPREANASIEEDLDGTNYSVGMPGQQASGGLRLGLSGSRGDLRMGAPGESAKMMASRAHRGGLGQRALPKPQQGGNGATVKAGRWKKGQLLGTGSFGQVYQGLNLDTGAMLAVKVLTVPDGTQKGQGVLEEIHREIDLMSSLSHANIVQYLGAEVDHRARELFIFQECVA